MNERVVPKTINFCVVKLSNSPAKAGPMSGVQPMSRANALGLTFVPRLELDGPALRHFDSQLDSLRINPRLPGFVDSWFFRFLF
jgi:hypothetical protein